MAAVAVTHVSPDFIVPAVSVPVVAATAVGATAVVSQVPAISAAAASLQSSPGFPSSVVDTLAFSADTGEDYDQIATFAVTTPVQSANAGYIALQSRAGSSYSISFSSVAALTVTVYDSNGVYQTSGFVFGFSWTAPTTGTYYLAVSSQSANFTYSLTVRDRISLPLDPSTATYQDNFYSLLAGGNSWWHDKSYTGTPQETTDGVSGARHTITYSFALTGSDLQGNDYTGFQAMGSAEQAAVQRALAYISSQYDITFVQVAAGQGDIRYGSNNQGTVSEAYTAPDFSGGGTSIFVNNSLLTNTSDYSQGTYAYLTLIHETGHALGLKHPGDYNASGGGTPTPWLPATTDNHTHTVMSYNDASDVTYYSFAGTPTTGYQWTRHTLYPESYQLYDYDALQYLYGARKGVHLGDVSWSANAIFMETLYADSGLNIIDVSNQTLSSDIDLRADHFSSIAKRVTAADKLADVPSWVTVLPSTAAYTYDGIDNLGIASGSHFDEAKLGAGTNTVVCNDDGDTIICGTGTASITGGAGNDVFQLGTGSATINGEGGTNTASISGAFASYTVTSLNGTISIRSATGAIDTLTNVTSVQFSDRLYKPGVVLTPPVITNIPQYNTLVAGHAVALDTLFTATDPAGTISSYEFGLYWGPPGGHFRVNGIDYAAGQTVDVAASDLGSAYFVGGTTAVNALITITATDGVRGVSSTGGGVWVFLTQPVAPVITITQPTAMALYGQSIAVSSLFTATDASGTIDSYIIQDTATGAHAGHIVVNGVAYAAGQAVTVSAALLSKTYLVTGNADENDTISIQAIDSVSATRSSALTSTITTLSHLPPVLTIIIPTGEVSVYQQLPLSWFFSASEAGGTITGYELVDNATGPSAGHFRVDGVDYAAGATVDITAAQLASSYFIASTGSDTISVKATDGQTYSTPKTFAINVVTAPPPIVTTASNGTLTVAHGQYVNVSSLFSVSDPSGLAITEYRVTDLGHLENGTFVLDGVVQGKTVSPVIITASQLASFGFQSGSGSDQFEIQAYNGYSWSTQAQLTITAPIDQAPVATAQSVTPPRPGQTVNVSSLFSVTDAEGDTVRKYLIELSGSDGGYLTIAGVRQSPGFISTLFNATDFSSVTYTMGKGTETIGIEGYDGVEWATDWTSVRLTATNIAPSVSARSSLVNADHLQSFSFSDLFAVSDPQNVGVTRYDFYDNTPGNGAIILNGVEQASGVDVVVTAAQLSSLSFTASGSDTLSARVFNGQTWSAYQKVAINGPADTAPLPVSALPLAVQPRVGTVIAVTDLFSPATDTDQDAITEYRFYDATPGGGTLRVNGVNQLNNTATVAASNLGSVTFTAGASDQLYIRSYDGFAWSSWKIETIAGTNLLPVVTAGTSAVSALHMQSFGFSDLFSTSDPQNSAITKYDFYDGTVGDGSIRLNGVVQAAQTDVVVNASQLSSLSFVASGGTDLLYARVWDGYSWSARVKVTIGAPANQAPGVTAVNASVITAPASVIAISDLFSASDPDHDVITQYLFYDTTPGGGSLRVGTVAEGTTPTYVSAANLGSVTFKTGANGTSDLLYVRAYDGITWSPWATITIKGSTAAAPQAAPLPTLSVPVSISIASATAPLHSLLQPTISQAWGFAAAS